MGSNKKLSRHFGIFSSLPWLNKYTFTILAFVVWLCFFDKYNLITQYRLSHTLTELNKKKILYENELDKAIKERQVINSDIEKYAREKYLMHKDNEQVIIIK